MERVYLDFLEVNMSFGALRMCGLQTFCLQRKMITAISNQP